MTDMKNYVIKMSGNKKNIYLLLRIMNISFQHKSHREGDLFQAIKLLIYSDQHFNFFSLTLFLLKRKIPLTCFGV